MVIPSGVLEGQVIVVAGSQGLIGRALTRGILDCGGNVIGLDTQPEEPSASDVDRYLELRCDVTIQADLETSISQGVGRFGRIDGGVFSAYPRAQNGFEDFENFTARGLSANLFSHLGSQLLFAQIMMNSTKEGKPLSIVFLGSIQGLGAPKFKHYEGLPMSSPIEYSVSKAGLTAAAKWLSARYGDLGHRFNVLSPGGIADRQPAKFAARYRQDTLTKGLLDPNDLSGTAVFLLSQQSQFLTGQNLVVDDGWSL